MVDPRISVLKPKGKLPKPGPGEWLNMGGSGVPGPLFWLTVGVWIVATILFLKRVI